MESGIHDDAIIVEQEARESDFHDRRQREIQLSAYACTLDYTLCRACKRMLSRVQAYAIKSLEPSLADAVKRMKLRI